MAESSSFVVRFVSRHSRWHARSCCCCYSPQADHLPHVAAHRTWTAMVGLFSGRPVGTGSHGGPSHWPSFEVAAAVF